MDRASWIHGFVTSQRSEDYSYRMGNEAEREERNRQFVSMAGRIYDATFEPRLTPVNEPAASGSRLQSDGNGSIGLMTGAEVDAFLNALRRRDAGQFKAVAEPRVHWFDGALSWLKQRMA